MPLPAANATFSAMGFEDLAVAAAVAMAALYLLQHALRPFLGRSGPGCGHCSGCGVPPPNWISLETLRQPQLPAPPRENAPHHRTHP